MPTSSEKKTKASKKQSDASKHPPKPIFVNLNDMENPFYQDGFEVSGYFVDIPVAGSDKDFEYGCKFLYSYIGSSATFNAYRRDIERLLQWSWHIRSLSALRLRRQDIEEFIGFCQRPPLAWIGLKNVSRFQRGSDSEVINPDWRPFVVSSQKNVSSGSKALTQKDYQMSQAAVKALFAVISSFYAFLVQEGLAELNPVLMIRQKSRHIQKQQFAPPIRRISNLQWDYLVEVAETLAAANPRKYERALFIVNCLFGMYLRISELVADERSIPTMGDFRRDRDANWWFHVTGKGNKNRIVTVSDSMLEAIKRYRLFRGLTPLPALGESSPLVQKQNGNGPVTSTRQIRTIVQELFDAAFEKMMADGLADDAQDLRTATVHWLRHTGISEDVKTRPREHVRDDAGHASMATTDKYIESELRERHASGKKKPLKDL